MLHRLNRRHAFGTFVALASTPLISRNAAAQFGSPVQDLLNLCPAGTKGKVTISTEFPNASAGITLGGSGLNTQVPVRRIKWTLECEQIINPPPPPPPPTPPKLDPWVPFDYLLMAVDPMRLAGYQAADFYLGVSLPSFLALTSTQAQLSAWATLANGAQQAANFGLTRDGNGYRFSNPGAVDYWASTAAYGARFGAWDVAGVVATSVSSGSGRFGVAQSLGGFMVSAAADFATVSVPNTRGTNVNNR